MMYASSQVQGFKCTRMEVQYNFCFNSNYVHQSLLYTSSQVQGLKYKMEVQYLRLGCIPMS